MKALNPKIKDRLDELKLSGVQFPMPPHFAQCVLGVGPTMIPLLQDHGYVMRTELNDLSTRCRNVLEDKNLTDKQQVVEAIKSGEITVAKIRNMGKKSFEEICAWAGVSAPEFKRCPHCNQLLPR